MKLFPHLWKRHAFQCLATLVVAGMPFFAVGEDSGPSKDKQRTYLFSRSQLKYGLERDDYLSRWIDRPLFVDPTLKNASSDSATINEASYRQMQAMAQRYGLDGFAFFPEVKRTQEVYRLTRANAVPNFLLLSEFGSAGSIDEKVAIAGMALEHPASFRIDGKVVFTSYGADRKKPEYWATVLGKIKERYGDHFIFLPAIVQFNGKPPSYWIERFDEGKITPMEFEGVKESLRAWLRVTDGLYFASTAGIKRDRRFHEKFYRDFIIKAMTETLAEPEFEGKHLGLSANIGHENSTRFGYTQSSSGTKTLRESLEAAIDVHPNVINIPEWDEQNENTSLRPTVYNSLSSLRIIRYYSAKLRNEPLEPLPGDDQTIPNLTVSYRKLLTLGEKLELELLNIPDSTNGEEYKVRVRLADLSGKVVYTSPELTFKKDEMKDQTLAIPSEAYAGYDALVPTIETISADGTRSFSEGLHYVGLRPTSNWDYKWVKQPLRDLMASGTCEFTLGNPEADGRRVATVDFKADEPINHLELLDNDDVIYSHTADQSWRENDDEVVISLSWQARELLNSAGSVSLNGAPNARWLMPKEEEDALQGNALSLGKLRVNHWARQVLVAIPRSDLENAFFEVDLKPLPKANLPVREIIERSVYGFPGEKGYNLVFSRYLRQQKIPAPLGAISAQFSTFVLPDLPDSVLHVQAVGKSGRLYRSKPIVTGVRDSGAKSTQVISESTQKPVVIELKEKGVPDIQYVFNPEHGSVLYANAGRPFLGILGGYVTQATGRGGAESKDGTPFLKAGDYPEGNTKTHPDWVAESDGRFSLDFDGKGTFASLPQGVVPRRSAFSIEMEIKPESLRGKEVLFANRSYYPGAITIYLDSGTLKARFSGEKGGVPVLNSHLSLEAGKWSSIKVVYDQAHLWFVVNGKASRQFAVSGPGMYDTVSVLGGFGDEWFKGRIKSLRIRHTAEEEQSTL